MSASLCGQTEGHSVASHCEMYLIPSIPNTPVKNSCEVIASDFKPRPFNDQNFIMGMNVSAMVVQWLSLMPQRVLSWLHTFISLQLQKPQQPKQLKNQITLTRINRFEFEETSAAGR